MFNSKKSKIDTDAEKIEKLLTRNVDEVFVEETLRKRLLSGDKLVIKLGFDPTGSKIHIGRAVVLHKLREFQDLGHEIVFLVGNFTAKIGDPSDKLEKRPMLDDEKIKENLRDYKEQVGKIVDLKKAKFVYNADWLSKLKFDEIIDLAESFSVSQMTNRRNFKERLDKGEEVSLREFLYPLMQGYDSVALKADVELGGSDQLFNLKAGRTIQRHYGMKEQDVLTTIMLEGTDGRKMSTSWGNVINIVDEPSDMYGKVMSLKDNLIIKYLRTCTRVDEKEILEMEKGLGDGSLNPKDIKMFLARELVLIYHGEAAADSAEKDFVGAFQKGDEVPSDATEITVTSGAKLAEVLIEENIVPSKSEWRRLVESGAITNFETGEKISDPNFVIEGNVVLRVGKRKFVKIFV